MLFSFIHAIPFSIFLCKHFPNTYLHPDLFPDFRYQLDMHEIRHFIRLIRSQSLPPLFLLQRCWRRRLVSLLQLPSHQPSATGSRLLDFTLSAHSCAPSDQSSKSPTLLQLTPVNGVCAILSPNPMSELYFGPVLRIHWESVPKGNSREGFPFSFSAPLISCRNL